MSEFHQVDDQTARAFFQAANVNDSSTASRILEEVGACGWNSLFQKARNIAGGSEEDFRLSSHSSLDGPNEEFTIEKITYVMGGLKGASSPTTSEIASVASTRCDAAAIPTQDASVDLAKKFAAALRTSQGMDVARFLEHVKPDQRGGLALLANQLDHEMRDQYGNRFRVASQSKRVSGTEWFTLTKTQYLTNFLGSSEPSVRKMATLKVPPAPEQK
jgi:hypothetical protein